MDVLNFISWVKSLNITSTLPNNTLIPVGIQDPTRGDSFLPAVITSQDLLGNIPAGAQGPQGPQGVPGPVGPAGLNWQGAWSAAGTYVVDDAVGYAGASWFCINNVALSPINPATDTTNWALLASQGATGPQGPQGIQGPAGSGASFAFSQVNNTPQYAFPVGIKYIADYLTIPANTFNSTTKAVLELSAQVSKIGLNATFTIEAYITNTLPTLNSPVVTGTKLGGAITIAPTQRTQKIEREVAVNGNAVYYFNVASSTTSNSDSAVLASASNYDSQFFDSVFGSVAVNWSQNVYISLVISAGSSSDLFGARYITISRT